MNDAVQVNWEVDKNPLGIKDASLILRPINPNSPLVNIPGLSPGKEAFCKVYGSSHEETAEYIVRAADLTHQLAMVGLPLEATLADLIQHHRAQAGVAAALDTMRYTAPPEVYVIQREECGRDADNYNQTTTTLEEDYGFFIDAEAVTAKVNELNADLLAEYEKHTRNWKQQKFIRCLSFYEWTHSSRHTVTVYTIQKIERAA